MSELLKWQELELGKPYRVIRDKTFEVGCGYLINVDNPKIPGYCPLKFKISDYIAGFCGFVWGHLTDEFETISEAYMRKYAREMDARVKAYEDEREKEEKEPKKQVKAKKQEKAEPSQFEQMSLF